MTAKRLFIGGLLLVLAGCDRTDKVLFITNSSLGIDVDPKLAVTSIAYDRTEGFFGPRYANGALPPVVGSINSGGNIFNPVVQQVYATGEAALRVADSSRMGNTSLPLSGDKKLAFFGTSTTLGLKVSFSAEGVDSMNFGYKRREFSFIPLGTVKDKAGNSVDSYPSVLASIDSTTTVGKDDSGLKMRQFFATGAAAETMAEDPMVQAAFREKAKDTALAGLTDDQKIAAQDAADPQIQTQKDRVDKILSAVTVNGKLDPASLGKLVDKAYANQASTVPANLKTVTDLDILKGKLAPNQPLAKRLVAALPLS